MVLKYSSTRPDDELDGMQDYEEHFLTGDPDDVVAVVVISRNGIAKKDPAPFAASIKVKHIEPVTGDDADVVRKLLRERYARRTGNEMLPLDDVEEGAEELPSIPWGGETE